VGFPEINIDLIAGMVGDTQAKWEETVEKALALAPDCLTVYQMEVPFNTVLAREAKEHGATTPVVSWATKRAWVDHAFRRFESAGYRVSSATTVYKPDNHEGFYYRDALWHGSDMIGMGVASFSHLSGVHFQNLDSWEEYIGALGRGELPLSRAYVLSERERYTRELILQLKLGRVDAGYFREKFGVQIGTEFAEAIGALVGEGMMETEGDELRLTRPGLLCVDALLPRFFEPRFRNVRYT
jgi:oxygen-independent coproporphyrinogen-3 oxidase